jgi:hypothetical protein
LNNSPNFATSTGVISGQPLFEAGPASLIHSSSLSTTPSPSVSGQGHPLFAAGPATVGQASNLSTTPSPSPSGQPLFA